MKRFLPILLALFLVLSACTPAAEVPPSSPPASSPAETTVSPSPSPSVQPQQVNVALLKGPIGMGAAKLMSDGGAENNYEFTLFSANDEVVAGLAAGTLDIAGMATNVAANLYNKTNGSVRIIAINTLGVLHILENGDTIQSVADLKGKTIYAMGQGANPEYVLRHLIEQSGGSYDDVTVEWRTQEEVIALMADGTAQICMLPVPAATTVLMKNSDVRDALDLTEVWAEVTPGSKLAQSCFVARAAFIDEHPEAVAAFLTDLAVSVAFTNAQPAEAGALVERFEIVPSAAIAAAAIAQANLVCITGSDMQSAAQGYYEVLFAADPASIGGANPDDAFYYVE